jgi:hypothetical protein
VLLRLNVRGRLFFAGNPYRQPFSAFGTASGQYTATGFGLHARPKAVVVQHLSVRRLIRSFHLPHTFISGNKYNWNKLSVKGINHPAAAFFVYQHC